MCDVISTALMHAKGVGYLTPGEDYPRGEVPDAAFERLIALVKHSFVSWCGYHDCELESCGVGQPPPELKYNGLVIPTRCDSDILVPGQNLVWVAPALILHYIRCHHYVPPASFLEAVLACPEPASPEYLAALEKICSH